MRELVHKESWASKNWCFWTVVLEKTLESPLACKEIPVHPKGDQSWIFIGGTDAEAEATVFWSPDAKNWHIGKDPDARKDWRQEEKGTTEDEMVGWHHQLNEHVLEQAQGVVDGQGSLTCCSPWGCKESDKTERLNWTDVILFYWWECEWSSIFTNTSTFAAIPPWEHSWIVSKGTAATFIHEQILPPSPPSVAEPIHTLSGGWGYLVPHPNAHY